MRLHLKQVPVGVNRMSADQFRSLPEAPKKNKFGAKPTVVDDIRFDSALEAKRWSTLQLMQRAGMISHLDRQKPYPLVVNGNLITTYIADYVYQENSFTIVEDAKGKRTPAYKLKVKLMKAIYGIVIREHVAASKSARPKGLRK